MKYSIKYKVTGYEDREFESDQYDSLEKADLHLFDIAGYDGVHSAYINPILETENNSVPQ